jgi:hypothetical protein
MSRIEYFLQVQTASTGGALYDIRKLSAVDNELTLAEKEDVSDAISRRFSQINLASKPNFKPRWA